MATTNEIIKANKEKVGKALWGRDAEGIKRFFLSGEESNRKGRKQYIAAEAALDYLGGWGCSGRGITLAETILAQLGGDVERYGSNAYSLSEKQLNIVVEFLAAQFEMAALVKEGREKGNLH